MPRAARGEHGAPAASRANGEGERRSGAKLLIAWAGARHAPRHVKRTKQQALALARQLARELREQPADFADVARTRSDAPSARFGGEMGSWRRGQMVPAFERVFDRLREGEVSEPVETVFGYYLLIRRPVKPPITLAASNILVSYHGAGRAGPAITRSKKQAALLARRLAARVTADPSAFPRLAATHSDGPAAAAGGRLPVWTTARSPMPTAITAAVKRMKVGAVAVVETGFGYHVLRREPVPPRRSGSQILIAYKGARDARPSVLRTREQARELAALLTAQLRKDPARFAELVASSSDCPSRARGGRLGSWYRGKMPPAFEAAIEQLAPGQISPPVETERGFHIIRREKDQRTDRR